MYAQQQQQQQSTTEIELEKQIHKFMPKERKIE
jgi:hypothetical protein